MQPFFIRVGIGAIASLAIALTALASTTTQPSALPAVAQKPIEIAVSNWKFVPSTITIPAGEKATIRLTSTQGVHGIQSDALGISQTLIPNGKSVQVSITPKTPGNYVVHCSVFCGAGHPNMALTITVAAPVATTTSAVMRPAIKITASNWKFVPAAIKIPVGALTTLRLTATSGVHGIQSKELGIPLTTITKGKTVDVKFTPKKTGTYILHCAIFCGPGHAAMKLKIQVVSS